VSLAHDASSIWFVWSLGSVRPKGAPSNAIPLYTHPAPASDVVEVLRDAFRRAFITSNSDGQNARYEVTAKFPSLRLAQDAHDALISALSTKGREAVAAAVPEGWKLVPVEPTGTMIAAGREDQDRSGGISYSGIYRAMLAAAPSPLARREAGEREAVIEECAKLLDKRARLARTVIETNCYPEAQLFDMLARDIRELKRSGK